MDDEIKAAIPKDELAAIPVIKDFGEVADVSDIAADIIDDMPAPSDNTIEQLSAAETVSPNPPGLTSDTKETGFITDTDGNSFNADIHQIDAAGKPRIGVNGKLMKKRGRKKGSAPNVRQPGKSTIGGGPAASDTGAPALSEAQRQQAAVTGVVSASLLINVSMMLGGDDFAPVLNTEHGIDEKKALESGFTDYFIATGKTDFPPGVALTLVVSMYILPRLTKPKVQSAIKAKGGKIYTWWHERKARKLKTKQEKENGAQSNTGNDGKRENDISETTSANLQS